MRTEALRAIVPVMSKANKREEVAVATEKAAADTAPASAAPETESPSALFEKMLEGKKTRPVGQLGEPFVAECIDANHPTLRGRVRIRLTETGVPGPSLWVPTLQGLPVRAGDRLLLQTPHGGSEPVVIGVIDGFLPRPEPDRSVAARIEVKQDEVIQVCSPEGQPLVEILHDAKGPMVRLLQSDTRLDVKGKLSITAAELELRALKGEVRIQASQDVNLIGEIVKLN
jgi:hypothetical protein